MPTSTPEGETSDTELTTNVDQTLGWASDSGRRLLPTIVQILY